MNNKQINKRLEYLRGGIEAERISMSELAELQNLVKYIKPGDVQLLQWAGVPESKAYDTNFYKCEQCGSDEDSMVAFTENKICGKCTRKNHKAFTK